MIVLLDVIDKLCDRVSKGNFGSDINELIFSHKVNAGHCIDNEWKKVSSDSKNVSFQEIDMKNIENIEEFGMNHMDVLESLYVNIIHLLKVKEIKMAYKYFDAVLHLWKQTILFIHKLWNLTARVHR